METPTTAPTPATETAVAKRQATPVDIVRARAEDPRFLEQLRRALPDGKSGMRLVRGAITAMQRNPSLAQAAAGNQESFFAALLQTAQMGLELDGRQCHLVPFHNSKTGKTEIQSIPDYKGLVELVMESGKVSMIHADVVCDADEFEWDMGEIKHHRINLRAPRGEAYAAYAFARFKDGSQKAEVMSAEEIEAIRRRSRNANSGPWQNDWSEMAKKTCFKRLSKWLPLSPEATAAIDIDTAASVGGETTVVSDPPTIVPKIPPRPQKTLGVSAADTEEDLAAMRQQAGESTPGPAVGIARRGPGRPRKNPVQESPVPAAEPTQEHTSISALRLMMKQHGLTEAEVCQAGFEFSFTKPEKEPRGSIAEWEPEEADLAVKNSVALIEAINELRNPSAQPPPAS